MTLQRTKEETLKLLWKIALRMSSDGFSRTLYNGLWDIGLEWNDANPDNEIFVYEDFDEDGNLKLYIEDDYLIIKE